MSEGKVHINNNVVLLFLFLLSYGVVFALSLARDAVSRAVSGIPVLNLFLPLPLFDSPTFLLLPVVGFFLAYFIVDWVNDFFKTRFASSAWFVVLVVLLSMLAFYISLFWYFSEIARFQGNSFPVFDFWAELRGSPFYLFVLSTVLGWVSKKIVDRL